MQEARSLAADAQQAQRAADNQAAHLNERESAAAKLEEALTALQVIFGGLPCLQLGCNKHTCMTAGP